MNPKSGFGLIKDSFKEWQDDDSLSLGAALAYYAIFSLAPMLLIVIAVASTPEPCLPALAIMDWMASPPCGPTSPRSSPTSCPWTASRL